MKRIFNPGATVADDIHVELETQSKRRPNVAYKKLVVPVRMRSIYWKFFGFPADEDRRITTKDVIVCTLCRAQMVYNRNTSNLRTHLRCRHKDLISRIEKEECKGETDPSLPAKKFKDESNENYEFSEISVMNTESSSMTSRKSVKDVPTLVVSEEGNENDLANISIIFPNGEELLSYTQDKQSAGETVESTEMSDAIINFIVSDLIQPSIVDGNGFHRLMSSLSNKTVLIPNESRITVDIIPSIYIAAREQIHNSIISGSITNLSLSMEEWTSSEDVKSLSIYAHYFQSGCAELTTKILGSVLCTGINSAEEWGNAVEKLLSDWNINLDAISAVLAAFSLPGLREYLSTKDVIQIPCFMFLMEKLCSDNIFKLPSVTDLLKKCRLVMEIVLTSRIEKDSDCELNDNYDEYSSHVFGFDSSGSWLTTYYMLYGLLLRKNTIMEHSPACPLKTNDWKKINDLVDVLESLKTIVTTFFEEKCPMISLVNPLLWKVTNNVFESLDDDSSFITEVKKLMKNYLNQAYTSNDVRSFTEMTTMLDPRFKSFVKQNANYNLKKELEETLILLVKNEGFISFEKSQSEESSPSTTKKINRLSGMNMLFNNLKVKKQALTVEDKVRNEITYFEAEGNALLEECPLQWWQNMTNKCPNLVRIARKYLCVPAMILINDNDSILDRLRFYEKRAALKLEISDMLLFLHLNNES